MKKKEEKEKENRVRDTVYIYLQTTLKFLEICISSLLCGNIEMPP